MCTKLAGCKEGTEGRRVAIVMTGQTQSLQCVVEILEQDTDSDSNDSALYAGKIVAAGSAEERIPIYIFVLGDCWRGFRLCD